MGSKEQGETGEGCAAKAGNRVRGGKRKYDAGSAGTQSQPVREWATAQAWPARQSVPAAEAGESCPWPGPGSSEVP